MVLSVPWRRLLLLLRHFRPHWLQTRTRANVEECPGRSCPAASDRARRRLCRPASASCRPCRDQLDCRCNPNRKARYKTSSRPLRPWFHTRPNRTYLAHTVVSLAFLLQSLTISSLFTALRRSVGEGRQLRGF